MNYKELIHIAFSLISSPARAWEEIRLEEDKQRVYTVFVYPMIGLCGLSVFIGALLSNDWSGAASFQYAMTQCCAVAVSLFGGYFLAAWAIDEMGRRFFDLPADIALARRFAGYALVILFVLQIITGILPDFGIIALFVEFYTVYIVWEGSVRMMHVSEKLRLRFTVLSSILLIACPALVRLLFNELSVVLS